MSLRRRSRRFCPPTRTLILKPAGEALALAWGGGDLFHPIFASSHSSRCRRHLQLRLFTGTTCLFQNSMAFSLVSYRSPSISLRPPRYCCNSCNSASLLICCDSGFWAQNLCCASAGALETERSLKAAAQN